MKISATMKYQWCPETRHKKTAWQISLASNGDVNKALDNLRESAFTPMLTTNTGILSAATAL